MKRGPKLWICLVVVAMAVGAIVWLWPSGEPEIVTKARTLHKGMTPEQVKAILGQPHFSVDTKTQEYHKYRGGHDGELFVSAEPPFLHLWTYPRWELALYYEEIGPDPTRRLGKVTYYPSMDQTAEPKDIPIP